MHRVGLGLRLLLLLCCTAVCVSAMRREYYLKIEEINWNYAPSGMNVIQNHTLEAAVFLVKGPQRIGPIYKKAVYKQYSDATYSTEVVKPAWLGYLGPLLSAEEGDTVVIHLKNTASRAYSIHPHGLSYSKGNEGAWYPDSTDAEQKRDDWVAPGTTVMYEWTLPESHGPATEDGNCLSRFYHSHVASPRDIASGLIGPLITCKPGTLDLHGDRTGDYLYALMFMVSDENFSWYLDDNIRTHIPHPVNGLKDDEDFIESNKMHGINGYLYGNLPGLSVCQGNKIHWYLFGMGNEVDLHSVHFHGQILTSEKRHTDTISLFPGTSAAAEMVADNPGHWLLSCSVNDHLMAGMQALFEIKKCFPNVHKPRPHGELRQFFIAAEEEVWDYAPVQSTDGYIHEAETYLTKGPNRIGSRYKKVRYVEYTDNTFLTKMLRSPEEEHLGILGPVLRAEEKDTIRVVFKNKAGRAYSIQPHGVQYSIEQDGTLYHNELEGVVTPPPAALVKPGTVYTYEWTVPVDAGPVEGDADCLTYLYYSAVDPVKDTSSGLVGPLLICRPNTLKKGVQKNYDKEFHLLATVFDENLSWYLDDNIRTYTTAPNTVNKEDEDFIESNRMHGEFEVASATVNDYTGGMRANYTVKKCSIFHRQSETMFHSKTYYIAAMEMEWDYAPNRTWETEMFRGLHDSPAPIYLDKQNKFIGGRYKKVVYRQFTNDKFTTQVQRPPDMEHLGIMVSPMIHADVGDKVKIVFKNMATRAYSIHAHGVKTESPDVHQTQPGETHTYYWYVTKATGPTQEQEECAVGAYYSTVDVTKDLYSGLIGPLVICRRSWASTEFILYYLSSSYYNCCIIYYSRYLDENIRTQIRTPARNLKEDEDFIESNKMHSINGFVYANLNGLNMEVGDKVYWYLMGMGNEVDLHGAHWHGHSVEYKVHTHTHTHTHTAWLRKHTTCLC
uniref:Ceruloplasmin n=1 Tax=Myripristis murdjan TaxID=586833 RepID=A0A667WZL3_9TELE